MIVRWWLSCWLVFWTPMARAAEDADTVTASLIQVDLWLDLGELGKAVALTRRAVRSHPTDARWHLARIRSLHASGMDAWIDVEYAQVEHPAPAKAEAWSVWQVQRHQRLAPPDDIGGVLVGRLRVALDAQRGAPSALPTFLEHDSVARGHLVDAALVRKDWDTVLAMVATWSDEEGPHARLAPLAPVLGTKVGRLADAQRTILDLVDERIAGATHPLPLMDAAALLLAAGDALRLGAVADRIEAVFGASSMQDVMDGLMAGPAGWVAWEVPRRPAWTAEEMSDVAASLAKARSVELPWARPAERRIVAEDLAQRLQADGKVVDADRVRLAHTPRGCAWTRLPEVLVAQGRGREGRALAEDLLFRCIGGVELVPTSDPANLDVDAEADELAGAWFRFGVVADLGHSFTDAALAYAISARLQPDPDRAKLAAARARAAGLAHDRSGIPPVEVIRAAIGHAKWLDPAKALERSRARRGIALTLALLDPSPERLANRALPENLCLPTLRDRCALERAAAAEAFRRAGRAVPESVQSFADRGAERAAPGWLDRQEALWFQRSGALSRAVRDQSGTDRLGDVVRDLAVMREGRPMPEWSSRTIRSIDVRGRVLVLAFWGSWCRRCQAQLAFVDGLAAGWARDGIDAAVLAISLDDDLEAYRRALGRLPLDNLTLLRDDRLRASLKVGELPTLVVVDPSGVVRSLREGYGGTELAWLDAAVRAAAQAASRPDEGG